MCKLSPHYPNVNTFILPTIQGQEYNTKSPIKISRRVAAYYKHRTMYKIRDNDNDDNINYRSTKDHYILALCQTDHCRLVEIVNGINYFGKQNYYCCILDNWNLIPATGYTKHHLQSPTITYNHP